MTRGGLPVLIACSLLAAVLGTVHAFSVFLEPFEARFGASRASVSLTYSLALMALTGAVLIGHRVFARWPPALFVPALCAMAAAGAVTAGYAPTLAVLWLGYGLIFGAANGLGYGFGLQLAAQASPGREGLAMGTVTAAYALGAVLAPALFARALTLGGAVAAMTGLAAAVMITGLVAAVFLARAGVRFRKPETGAAPRQLAAGQFIPLWLGYFGGVLAGLMVIGHAAAIATALRPGGAAWIAPAIIAVCNLGGSLVAGRLSDRIAPARLLIGLPLLSAAALLILIVMGRHGGLMPALGLTGFSYGAIIAAYPAVIAKRYGILDSPRIYGRVFTAWGAAGLAGPWLAGYLFDLSGGYRTALIVAVGAALASALAALMQARDPSVA